MNPESTNPTLIITIICAIIAIFLCIIAILSVIYLHTKIIKLETKFNLWTKNPGLLYDNENRRVLPPPLPNPQPEKPPEKNRHLSANSFQSQNPLQKKRAEADRKMDERLGIKPKTAESGEEQIEQS